MTACHCQEEPGHGVDARPDPDSDSKPLSLKHRLLAAVDEAGLGGNIMGLMSEPCQPCPRHVNLVHAMSTFVHAMSTFVQASANKNIGDFLFNQHGADEGKRLQFAKVPHFKLSYCSTDGKSKLSLVLITTINK